MKTIKSINQKDILEFIAEKIRKSAPFKAAHAMARKINKNSVDRTQGRFVAHGNEFYWLSVEEEKERSENDGYTLEELRDLEENYSGKGGGWDDSYLHSDTYYDDYDDYDDYPLGSEDICFD